MSSRYQVSFEGIFAGVFQPIRFENGAVAYQSVDEQGRLLGILWDDGRYADPYRNGNLKWELCEETEAHRDIIKLASQPWQTPPYRFRAL